MLYILLIGPFTFFNVQKTKYLQIIGFLMRIIGKFYFNHPSHSMISYI